MTEVRVVLITAPRGDVALRIAHALIDNHLAACVNVVPGITSVYRWEGKVCEEGEDLLIAKTTVERVDALIGHVRSIHPYTVPEVIALPVEGGSETYLRWVEGEVR